MDNIMTTDLDAVYQRLLMAVDAELDHASPLAVAAVATTIGLSLYRTVLDEQNFLKMVETIAAKSYQVKPFDSEDTTIH